MHQVDRFQTIDNDWDRLYREYPEIYDRFAENMDRDQSIYETINRMFELHGKIVLDVGSGTGRPTINLARYASFVFGIEPEAAMRRVAVRNATGIRNVRFLGGKAGSIPLDAKSVDAVIAITSIPVYHRNMSVMRGQTREFMKEALRVLKEGGVIAVVSVAPFWYGGELASVILGDSRVTEEDVEGKAHKILADQLGFQYRDIGVVQKFNSLEEALGTYGFIFGRNAMEYLIAHSMKKIRWKFRMY